MEIKHRVWLKILVVPNQLGVNLGLTIEIHNKTNQRKWTNTEVNACDRTVRKKQKKTSMKETRLQRAKEKQSQSLEDWIKVMNLYLPR